VACANAQSLKPKDTSCDDVSIGKTLFLTSPGLSCEISPLCASRSSRDDRTGWQPT